MCVAHTHIFRHRLAYPCHCFSFSSFFPFRPESGRARFCCSHCCLLLAAAVACYCYFITRKHAKMSFEWGKKREKKTKSNDALTQLDSRSRCYFHFVGIGVCVRFVQMSLCKRGKRLANE